MQLVLDSPEISGDYAECTPLPRPGEVDDVANTALFLLSDAAQWVTGQIIGVDGGQSLRRGRTTPPCWSRPMVPTACGASSSRAFS